MVLNFMLCQTLYIILIFLRLVDVGLTFKVGSKLTTKVNGLQINYVIF